MPSIGWLTQKRNRPSVDRTGTFPFAALISKRVREPGKPLLRSIFRRTNVYWQ
jgi:hypothetical protein